MQVRDSSVLLRDSASLYSNMRWGSYERVTIDGHRPLLESRVRPVPAAITAAVYAGAFIGLHEYQANAWWKNDRGPFHFEEDWSENLQNDKFGHFYGAYMMSYASREALLASGFNDATAHDLGALMGALLEVYVEVEDGFSTSWGFSPTDAYADIAGAMYFFAQRYVPALQTVHEKWIYYPSKFLGSGSIPGQQRTFIDDYQGQSYWWCVDVWHWLPPDMQRWYPKWLQLSVGYTARKYGPYVGPAPPGVADPWAPQYSDWADTREVYIGLDYNLPRLIGRTNIPFVDWLVQTCDNFHLPAPALRIVPSVHGFILYPIHFTLGSVQF